MSEAQVDAAGLTPMIRTLVISDLVDSTALVERLGDRQAIMLFRRHDRIVRMLVERHNGREIDKTDGFLLMFERPTQAVSFAVDYQRMLYEFSKDEQIQLRARVGIHIGDVLVWENAREDIAKGVKPLDVEGLAKPVTARLMSLAQPGQILLSGIAQGLLPRNESDALGLRLVFHGHYNFKGVPEPIPVFEVGNKEIAPFSRPPSSEKAWRHVPRWRTSKLLRALAVGVLAMAVGALAFSLSSRETPALAFAERDWVVVAHVRNLTGQAVLDSSIETALRISLEQSRFINVIPDLQMREALRRMQLPAEQPIDRVVGCEIALREGAHAVIVPTVTKVGGQLRVSVEVLAPANQATIYVASADGVGLESILPSIDRVTHALRANLGEALVHIERDSKPLAKVTTANLDALRAYSLGLKAQATGQFSHAAQLYEQAITIDPAFASAYLKLAGIFLFSGEHAKAWEYAERASSYRGRLSARDVLYLDAWIASFGFDKPESMLQKWSTLSDLYPDYSAGRQNFSLFAYMYTNRFEEAISSALQVAATRDPQRAGTYHLLGALYLGIEDYDRSRRAYEEMVALGMPTVEYGQVDLFSAMRQYDAARQVLAIEHRPGLMGLDLKRAIKEVSFLTDQGQLAEAIERARAAASQARLAKSTDDELRFQLSELALRTLIEPEQLKDPLRKFIERERGGMGRRLPIDRQRSAFNLAAAAYLAARAGHAGVARNGLDIARPVIKGSGFPASEWMLLTAEAEFGLLSGDPGRTAESLGKHLDASALYQARVAHARALAATKQLKAMNDAMAWLEEHRGRAFAEWNNHFALQPLNVADSNLATLARAEAAITAGQLEDARNLLKKFLAAWPRSTLRGAIDRRVVALEEKLHLE